MRNSAPHFSPSVFGSSGYLLVMLFAAALVLGCGVSEEQATDEKQVELETIEAEVISLDLRRWPRVVRSQGSLFADEQTVVGAKVAGRVAEVHVDLGDFVEEGNPLVTLDQEEFQLRVAQAEAQYQQTRSAVGLRDDDPVDKLDPENAPPVREEKALWEESKNNLERAASLRDQNAISQGEYDRAAAAERVADARYSSALNGVREKIALIGVRQAELSLARQQLRDAIIRAPMDGYVQQRQVSPGSYLTVGQSIAVMVRTDPLRFRGTVPERHAQSLAVGQEVRLKIESVPEPRVARITRVSPALDQQSRALAFEAEIENSDHRLRTGLFAEAEVVVDDSAEALVVPSSAIVEFAGAEKVWKVVDGVASEQEVLSGGEREQQREIVEGLAVGDLILLNGSRGRIARVQPTSGADNASALTGPSPDVPAPGQQQAQPDEAAPPAAAG